MNYLHFFEESVCQNRNRTALVDRDGARKLTYGILDELSSRTAAKLGREGVHRGDSVMIHMGRKAEYFVAYLGILKLGGVVVPVIEEYPEERIAYIEEDSQAKKIIRDDFFRDLDAYEPAESLLLEEEEPALLIYTSGSTGNPKGIEHTVESLCDAALRGTELYEGLERVVMTGAASLSFVATVVEYLSTFLVGGCTHMLSDAVRKNVRALEEYYPKNEITVSFISPQILRLFQCDSPHLKRVFAGSERLANKYSEDFEIFNVYGMSESGATISYFTVDRCYDNTPVGKALRGLEILLLDEEEKEVEQGESGEICVIGHLARGYRNLPEQTKKAFRRLEDGRILLHTGDCGRLDERGNLIYENRKDWMVKINGQRVETQEIEAAITALDEVASSVVKSFVDDNGQTYLVAYYVQNAPISQGKIRNTLLGKMPSYMIPRFFKRLEKMPVNINGKLDRKSLLPPDISEYKETYEAPADELEKAVCEGFEKVLQCGRIGASDDYIRMGGDSIKVLKLTSVLSEYRITPDMILRGRTPRGIAQISRREQREEILHQTERRDSYPLTDAQLGIYLDCVNHPGTKMYNIPLAVKLPEHLDLSRFEESVKTVIRAHEVFHVVVRMEEAGPVMVPVRREPELFRKQAEHLAQEKKAFVQPFDLEQGPLYRMELCEIRNSWYFLIDVHHLIFDGTSISVFLDEVAAVYEGNAVKQEKLTLFDAAVYEETLKETDAYKRAQEFFAAKLDGIETDSSLLPDMTPENPVGTAGQLLVSTHEEIGSAEVEQFTKRAGITESTLFLGVFAYALAKSAGLGESSFCTVNNGRHDERLSDATGMFVKTLPLHYVIEEEKSPQEFLQKVQEDFYETMSHDCISFGELVSTYQLRANMHFVYQAEMLSGPELCGEQLSVQSLETGEAQSDLNVMVVRSHGGYELILTYRDEIYREETIRNFAALMLMITKGMLAKGKLAEIPLADQETFEKMDVFNRTERGFDRGSVIDLFRKQAALYPEHPAVVYLDRTYTYAQVDDLSERIAGYLRAKGIGTEDVVSVLIPRCEYMVIASLGVLKAGAAYQPLDPTYPKERIGFMMQDASAKLLIAEEELLELAEGYEGEVLLTKEIPSLPECEAMTKQPAPEDLFILLYTSGSTGVPKGVMLEHRNVAALCHWYHQAYSLTPEDHVALYPSYGFDAHMMDLYPAVTRGACVHIIDESIRLDLMALNAYFEKNHIVHVTMTTQVGRQFVAEMENHSLRALSVGGEKLVPVDPPKYFDFYNEYGPTECTIIVSRCLVDRAYDKVPVGKPIDNLKLYVVDKEGRRLPVGMPGELWVAGHQVGRGYLNRPEQTQKVFIRNPFSQEEGYERIYRTGDIVRILADGTVDFIGRNDGMVKIRGFRIELSEVERVIRQYPGIKDATVADFDAAGGGKFLAAYVVSDETVDIEGLNAFIAERKPPYMVPAVTMQIDAIPLTQNQKVNKRALPIPEKKALDCVKPQNETQQRIFDCVAEVIGSSEFGITNDIYEAGVTSIGAIRLNVLLAKTFDIVIGNRDLKENNTVEKLERFIAGAGAAEAYEVYPDYPLTQNQNGIFVESTANADTTIYNVPSLFRLSGRVDTGRLQRAVEEAINAHPYVKVALFLNELGEVRAARQDDEKPQVELISCSTLPPNEELVQPFEMLGDKLYRARIYQTGEGNYLFLDFHHILYDGTSAVLMLRDINLAYEGEKLERETYSGFEHALWEEKQRKTEAYQKAKAYYDSVFAGCDTDFLPISDQELDAPAVNTISYECGLSMKQIEAFCQEHAVTPNAFFNGAFGYVLSRYCDKEEAIYTTVYNGRNDSRLSETVSMLVKTLPVYCNTAGSRKVTELLADVRNGLVESMANDIYSFAEIAEAYRIKADILFVYQGDSFVFEEIAGEKAQMCELHADTAKAPITIFVYCKGDLPYFTCEYRSDLYEESSMQGMLKALSLAASEFMNREYLNEISLTDQETLEKLDAFNRTETSYDRSSVVEQFRRQAAVNPERPAVVYLDRTYTYAQVDALTERIAGYLRAKGIGTEDVVSVLIPRCEYMVIASLGVLKAGAAYQPLDPTYPKERIGFMMQDASAKLLIAEEELMELAEGYEGEVLLTKEIPSLPECEAMTEQPAPEDLFILLYTSGSTGVPKGVMLEHRNLAAFCGWYRNFYGITASSKMSAYASYGFDADMMDLYPALTAGACVYIIDESIRLDLIALNAYFEQNGISNCFMTTQVGRQFVSEMENHSLKALSVGGEKLVPVEAPEQFGFYNGYGPTECTIFTTIQEVDRLYHRVPIGRALDNVRLYVVDKEGRRLPPGMPGELWIAGHQVGRGYLNRPEQTQKVFIRNPFSQEEGYECVYRTGDIVRFLADGRVDFIGRNDGQVKIRGFRIELSEVERVIRQYPGIKDATVADFDAAGGGKFLAAYVVSDETVDIEGLNAFIAERKPPYMVPAVTMQIDAIPLNQNQKVNKRALPVPERKAQECVKPQNETQQRIFDCVAEVIGSSEFGITTDIYEAGVTSIGAIRLNVLLTKAFDVVIKNRDLKENNTVEKLEQFIAGAGAAEAYEVYPDYPLTQTQNGIFVESVANAGTTVYNIPYLFRLSDRIEIDRLQKAVEEAINAHPYVKTTLFMNEQGDIRAARKEEEKAQVELISCKVLPPNEELVLPYEMLGEKLYRAKIYQTGEGNYLFLDFHHIICDGTSEGIMIRDINLAYEGKKLDKETYSGFEAALDEEKQRQTDAYQKAKAYYDSIFDGVDSNFLPPKDGEVSTQTPGETELVSELSVEQIKEYCRKNDITLNAFFNGVFAVVLSKYAYRDEAVYTTIYDGRNDGRLENTVSMLVKTLPVYCRTTGSLKITEMLQEVKKQLLESMANDLYSFGEISRAYNLPADILFAYQGESFVFDRIGGEKAENCAVSLDAVKAPLSVDIMIHAGKLTMRAEYQNDLYARETIQGMLFCIEKVTEEFLCKTYLKEVSMLSRKAEEQMNHFNATDYPVTETPVHELFEKQVSLHAEEAAVIADGRKLCYRELNNQANQLARLLIEKGLQIGEAVGILLPRIAEVPAAEYGILKAGGAFLPMLPDYPDERISYCLKDSGSRFVVTTEALREEKKELFVKTGCQVLTVEELHGDTDTENPGRKIPVDSLAYIIYTSGSTGTPKGVMIEHRNLCNFVDANPKNYETVHFTAYGRTALSVAAISFDFSLMEIHISLCNGMTVCMANEEEIYNPLSLLRLIEENHVDVISGTPSFILNVADSPRAEEVLRGIKMYDLGAEAFPEILYEKLHRLSPEAVIVNGYGPTEATISCISKVMDGSGKVTIGTPAANVRAYICDLDGNLLPAGARGELVISGNGVGRGYVNLPEKTQEVFISIDGRRAYRSGDLARYDQNGEIEFFGRLDNQVKLRGLRVELDEISGVMNRYPSVTHAIVLVKGEGQQQFLCGYYVAGTTVDKADLTEHMKKYLAPYMIPSVLIQLDAIPLTANGKINKKALPEPENFVEERDYTAPVNELQRRLAELFASALGMEKVGITEDFFALGGTSLTASKVAMKAMIEKIPIVYADVFDHPTVEQLEKYILSKQGEDIRIRVDLNAEQQESETEAGLSCNTAKYVDEISRDELGGVLLTGATGFLGIHVLKALLDKTDETVYCLIRKGKASAVDVRLKSMLVYYFSDAMEELFGKRIQVVEGDITDAERVETLEKYAFRTVINCAACVKHFVNDDTLDRINVQGVKNLVQFCSRTGRRLIQISTVSVAGDNVNDKFPAEKVLHENELFFGQSLDNKYIHTKFLAEKAVLESVAEGKLDGKIIRVGNLMSRHSDGEFQINFVTNGFMRMLRGYAIIGKFPVSAMDEAEEFSPIDCTAEAIVQLAGVNSKFTVFHACNSHRVQMGDVIEVMNHCGLKIDVVSEEAFSAGLAEALADEQKNMLVSGLISYLSSDSQNTARYIDYDNTFTVKALYRLGYKWPITDGNYLENAFMALKTLGFFDVE